MTVYSAFYKLEPVDASSTGSLLSVHSQAFRSPSASFSNRRTNLIVNRFLRSSSANNKAKSSFPSMCRNASRKLWTKQKRRRDIGHGNITAAIRRSRDVRDEHPCSTSTDAQMQFCEREKVAQITSNVSTITTDDRPIGVSLFHNKVIDADERGYERMETLSGIRFGVQSHDWSRYRDDERHEPFASRSSKTPIHGFTPQAAGFFSCSVKATLDVPQR